jgi:hypothetical protein
MTYREERALSGEYLTKDDAERVGLALERVKQQGVTAQVAARISRSVFFSTIQRKRVEAATAVIRAERELMGELINHQHTRARLADLDVEIEAERLARRNHLEAQKRQADLNELDAEIARKEREIRLMQLEKTHSALAGNGEDQQERKYREQLEAAERKAAFETEMKVLQARKGLKMAQDLRAERDRMIREATGGKADNLTPEQELEVENIRDFFQRLIDEL